MDPLTLIVLVVLVAWLSGYFGYGRTRWAWGRNGDIGALLVVLVLLVLLFGWPRGVR